MSLMRLRIKTFVTSTVPLETLNVHPARAPYLEGRGMSRNRARSQRFKGTSVLHCGCGAVHARSSGEGDEQAAKTALARAAPADFPACFMTWLGRLW